MTFCSENQPDLFIDLLPVRHEANRGESIQDDFLRFHESNPHIYRLLVRLARQAVASGRKNVGIGMLFEVLRWNYMVLTDSTDFKLNNNYRSRYARLIQEREPDLRGCFELRELRAV